MSPMVAVNTPVGQITRANIKIIVTQGGTFGILSVQILLTLLVKNAMKKVDDILTVSNSGQNALSMNINTKFDTPEKNGKSKCHKMDIGKPNHLCPEVSVHGTKIKEVTEDNYLGDVGQP